MKLVWRLGAAPLEVRKQSGRNNSISVQKIAELMYLWQLAERISEKHTRAELVPAPVLSVCFIEVVCVVTDAGKCTLEH